MKAKKKTLLHETQFGTKPVTPAKLKQQSMSISSKTPNRKVNQSVYLSFSRSRQYGTTHVVAYTHCVGTI
jgi:hypothetical protein